MTTISRDIKPLTTALENKNLSLTIYNNCFHIYTRRNDLLFVGKFEQVLDFIEAIEESEDLLNYLKPIEFEYFDPNPKSDYYLQTAVFAILAIFFFLLGIFSLPSLGMLGVPPFIAAFCSFYSFHKYKQ
jgi:hypothetical protein